MPSTFVNNVCDDFVLEMHYKVYFKSVTVEEGDAFQTPPDYDCESGAIFNYETNKFCPKFDLCA